LPNGSTERIDLIPRSHFTFLESCQTYFETERHRFVHANYKPEVPLDRLDIETLRWLSLQDYVPPSPISLTSRSTTLAVPPMNMPNPASIGPTQDKAIPRRTSNADDTAETA
jgi:hypothetical protein